MACSLGPRLAKEIIPGRLTGVAEILVDEQDKDIVFGDKAEHGAVVFAARTTRDLIPDAQRDSIT